MSGEHTLYVVATPIGNRDDIGLRAIATLRSVSCIFAEDTRHSAPLLRHHGIDTPLIPLHEHNEREQAERIAERIRTTGDAALISDAGTPAISDPGYRLVRACIEADVRVQAVPGASAVLAALVVSGLPTDRFEFVGFAPSREGARRRWLGELVERQHTLVLYESPHRIVDALQDVADLFGADRPVAVARELTKRFETVLRGSAAKVLTRIRDDADQRRGEFVVLIGAAAAPAVAAEQTADDAVLPIGLDRLIATLSKELPPRRASTLIAELSGLPRRDVYARVVAAAERGRS